MKTSSDPEHLPVAAAAGETARRVSDNSRAALGNAASVSAPVAPVVIVDVSMDGAARQQEESFLRNLVYGLSLPERLARSAVGVSAEAARTVAEFVVPTAFQSSKSYEVAVRNSLGFLITNVGKLQSAAPPDNSLVTEISSPLPAATGGVAATGETQAMSPGRFLARKTAGNFIDIAGLATLHVSPLWILAIVSDVAYGSRSYLVQLAQELQSQGLIDDSSTIHKVDDLLDAIQQASGTAASSFDQPPLSLEELRTSARQTRAALNGVDPSTLIPEAEIRQVWNQMQRLAQQEDLSLLGVSGAVAMQTVETIKGLSQGTMAGLFVAGNIVNRNIFGHYVSSLNRIREQGLWTTVRSNYEPYVDLAWNNFTTSHSSWTEQMVDAGMGRFRRMVRCVRGWFRKSPAPGV